MTSLLGSGAPNPLRIHPNNNVIRERACLFYCGGRGERLAANTRGTRTAPKGSNEHKTDTHIIVLTRTTASYENFRFCMDEMENFGRVFGKSVEID